MPQSYPDDISDNSDDGDSDGISIFGNVVYCFRNNVQFCV